ncbi:hypothetical protein AAEX28_00800 [Lentisphaerota bacterium WC36G]|nr:heparinase II/III-family protein [Lentisphaerae bacterium WC36]
MPYLAALAYDDVKDSAEWKSLSKKFRVNLKKKITNWLKIHSIYLLKDHFKKRKPNNGDFIHGTIDLKIGKMISPRWIKQAGNQYPQHLMVRAIGIGFILNSPEIMNYIAMVIEEIYKTGHYFYADGMWNEGTWSYHNYMWGNMDTVVRMLQPYRVPKGKESKVLDFALNGTSLVERYKNETDLIWKNQPKMKFPNGVAIYLHDGNGGAPVKTSVPQKNIEMHDYGLYTLNYGDDENSTQLSFHNCLLSSGGFGHHHTDNLNIIYWSKNQALIDEPGHPGSNYRYYNMGAAAHNIPLIEYKGREQYKTGRWARTSLLAYDDGTNSQKIVQYILGSSPTAKERMVRIQKRGNFLVAIDKKNSYIFDFAMLLGGHKHRFLQFSTKDEEVSQQTNAILNATGMKDDYFPMAFKSNLSTKWLPNGNLAKAKFAKANQDTVFTWTGKKSQNKLKTFIKGLKGQIIYNSFYPRIVVQRFMNSKDKDKFLGRRLDLYRAVSPGTPTLFAKIYESISKGQGDAIKKVTWLEVVPKNSFATAVKVELNNGRVDYIYISSDYVSRKVESLIFKGKAAIYSKTSDNKEAFSYVFGNAEIRTASNHLIIAGSKPVVARILKIHRVPISNDEFNGFDLATDKISNEAIGGELYIFNGDGSGNAYRINKVEKLTNGCRIYTEQAPAIDLIKGGVRRAFFPRVKIAGTPKAAYQNSKFIAKSNTIKELMAYNKVFYFWDKNVKITANKSQKEAQKLVKDSFGRWFMKKGPGEIKLSFAGEGYNLKNLSIKGYWRHNYKLKILASNDDENYQEVISGSFNKGKVGFFINNSKEKFKYYKIIINSTSFVEINLLKLTF